MSLSRKKGGRLYPSAATKRSDLKWSSAAAAEPQRCRTAPGPPQRAAGRWGGGGQPCRGGGRGSADLADIGLLGRGRRRRGLLGLLRRRRGGCLGRRGLGAGAYLLEARAARARRLEALAVGRRARLGLGGRHRGRRRRAIILGLGVGRGSKGNGRQGGQA